MQKKFQAGNLDRQITILQPTKTKSPRSGQEIIVYSNFHECATSLMESSGTEKNEDLGISEFNKQTFLIRYKVGVNVEMQVDFEGQRFNIKAFHEPQNTRRQWLIIDTIRKD